MASSKQHDQVHSETADDAVLQSHLVDQAELAEAERLEALADVGDLDGEVAGNSKGVQESQGEGSDEDEGQQATSRVGLKVLAWVVAAAAIAVATVVLVNAVTGPGQATELPETVTDPAVVVSALSDGGFDCSGAVVQGDVATCNSTIAVRIFTDGKVAQDWVEQLLRDPLTNSSVGWVRSGNVVVAAPLDSTPEIVTALGPQAKLF